MKILFKFGAEIFWTAFWVFLVLIVGFMVLTFLANKNIPFISNASSWVESHAQAN